MTRRSAPKVGTRVRFSFAGRVVTGKVIEDRGALGYEGRHVVRVRLDGRRGEVDQLEIEIDADRVRPLAA